MEFFIDKWGKKRKAITLKCEFCNNSFLSRFHPQSRYCSLSCKYEARKKRVLVVCKRCNKEFYKPINKLQYSKSGLHFCSRKCKDEAQTLKVGIKEIMPPHFGTGTGEYRYRELFTVEELFCHRCGYKEFLSSVQIHHIDKDRTHNQKENLIPLCANCHCSYHNGEWEFPLTKQNNEV